MLLYGNQMSLQMSVHCFILLCGKTMADNLSKYITLKDI